jgi:hypothetical protein
MDTNLIILIVTMVVLILYLCYKYKINIFGLILEIIFYYFLSISVIFVIIEW